MKRIQFTESLKHNELEALYEIGRAVAEIVEIDKALESIIKLTREVFIFDNIILYNFNTEKQLEPVFARAIGRGSASEAKLSWGESASKEIFLSGEKFIQNIEENSKKDRMEQQYILGLPMLVGGKITGSLLFIRFGGPEFTEDQINFSEFIATHISNLYNRENMVKKIANLEAERRLNLLQDDFIAMVSHDLNTPLGFIKGYTTTLLREDTNWDEKTQIEFLTIIDDETDRLTEMIENLLDSSKLQTQKLRMVLKSQHIDDVVSTQIERLKFLYPDLEFVNVIKDEKLLVKIDFKRIAQVIDNLINNASKYAPNSKILVTISKEANYAQISILDNGPGIEPRHLNHLFERFFRVPEQRAGVRGSGLGLFICDQIIRSHNGKILVESTVDIGTDFKILLPILDEEIEVTNG